MVAARGLHLQAPAKRPTVQAVMNTAFVSRETALKAFAALEQAGVDIGPKDVRGGTRGRFGLVQTKTAAKPERRPVLSNPSNAARPISSLDRTTSGDVVAVDTADGQQDLQAAAGVIGRETSFAATDDVEDDVNTPRSIDQERLRHLLDRVADLLMFSPEHVAQVIDGEFKAMFIDPVIADLVAWSSTLDAALDGQVRVRQRVR
jgi:hypothetical protein